MRGITARRTLPTVAKRPARSADPASQANAEKPDDFPKQRLRLLPERAASIAPGGQVCEICGHLWQNN